MAKTERRRGDYIFVDSLEDSQIQEFIDDCIKGGATEPPPLQSCVNDYTVQFDDDGSVASWYVKDLHERVDEPRDVTHEYAQNCTEAVTSPQKALQRIYDIREMSLTRLKYDLEIRRELHTVFTIIFDDDKEWWDISKEISGVNMIDTEKVMVIEMLYQVVHDALIEYHNNDKTILGEIFEEAEHKIKHVAMHLPFSQESMLYDWWAEFKQRYTLPCEDINEQSVLDMLSKAEGLTVELNKDGIVIYDHHLESEASVNTLDEAKDIIQGKQSYIKAFN